VDFFCFCMQDMKNAKKLVCLDMGKVGFEAEKL
jgi:hypothetical protein